MVKFHETTDGALTEFSYRFDGGHDLRALSRGALSITSPNEDDFYLHGRRVRWPGLEVQHFSISPVVLAGGVDDLEQTVMCVVPLEGVVEILASGEQIATAQYGQALVINRSMFENQYRMRQKTRLLTISVRPREHISTMLRAWERDLVLDVSSQLVDPLRVLALTFVSTAASLRPAERFVLARHLVTLLGDLIELGAVPRPGSHEELRLEVLRYIEANFDDDLSLESVARALNISKRTLQRSFAPIGVSHTVARVRVDMAIEEYRLHRSTMSIHELAKRVGFANDVALRRAFVRVVGLPPKLFFARDAESSLVEDTFMRDVG